MRQLARFLLSLSLLLVASGCSRASKLPVESLVRPVPEDTRSRLGIGPDTEQNVETRKREFEKREPPLDIDIGQAFLREGKLFVKVYLFAKTELETPYVSVTLSGLKDGSVMASQSQILQEIYPRPILEAGRSVVAHFELNAAGLTEYQVKVSWGEEAGKPSIPTRAETAASEASSQGARTAFPTDAPSDRVTLTGMEILRENAPCLEAKSKQKGECGINYTVLGRIRNQLDNPIRGVELALSLVWTNDGEQPAAPGDHAPLTENEEPVALPDVILEPGKDKRVRIEVDRTVPIVPGGAFVPHLRILSYREALEE